MEKLRKQAEKKISVIVPAYNVEKYLEYCIESIIKQTYKNIEVIIVNDGSTDSTSEIIGKVLEKDKRIKNINHNENKGLFQARITGVIAATGDYITFVDSDDSIGVDWLRLLLKKAMETESDIVLGNTICKSEDKNKYIYNVSYFMTRKKYTLENEEIIDYFMDNEGMNFSVHTVWNKLYSKELWKKSLSALTKIDKHFIMTEDIAFSVVLHYYAKKLTYSNHDGYFYYRNSDSSTVDIRSLNKVKKNVNDLMISFTFLRDFLREKNLFDKYKEKYINWKNRYYRWWCKVVEEKTEKSSKFEREIRKSFLNFFNKIDFEVPKEDDSFFTDVTTTWNEKYEKIKKQIIDDTIEYVSFDVFDTLIMRPFLEPTDIFIFMEEDFHEIYNGNLSFKDMRIASEKKCRQKMNIIYPEYQDITLEEIYKQMQTDYMLSETDCNNLMRKEEKLEIQFCNVRKTGKELYEMAYEVGKRIILISDMYLQTECINAILKKNGYSFHERLFLSSEERKLKYNGDLFRVAIRECNILPASILHIGDDYNVDYMQATKIGCKAIYLPKPKDILFNKLNDEYTGDSVNSTFSNFNAVIDVSVIMSNPTVRCLYALVANKIFDNPFVSFNPVSNYNRDTYFIGYFVVGMHLLGISRWLVKELKNSDYKKIHFLARDGYLIKKVYDLSRKYEADLPKSNYVYVSRKSMITADIRTPIDLHNIKKSSLVFEQTPESIYKLYANILKTYDEEMKSLLLEKGILPNKKFVNEQDFDFFINQLIDVAYDEQKSNINFRYLSDYLKKEIGKNDVTFDLGYSGKIQSNICTVLGFPVDGFFLHTNGFELTQRERLKGFKIKSYYDYATPMSGIVNEFIFSDFAPSCIGYKKENDEIKPVFEDKEILYQEKFLLNEIAFGCLSFIDDFYKTFGEYLCLFDFQPMDTSLAFERFMINPKWFDINLFKHCYLEDEYYGGISKKKLSDHWWWQMNKKNLFKHVNNHNELENMYKDGVFVSFYKKMNEKYPIGSKKREKLKKLARIFIK